VSEYIIIGPPTILAAASIITMMVNTLAVYCFGARYMAMPCNAASRPMARLMNTIAVRVKVSLFSDNVLEKLTVVHLMDRIGGIYQSKSAKLARAT